MALESLTPNPVGNVMQRANPVPASTDAAIASLRSDAAVQNPNDTLNNYLIQLLPDAAEMAQAKSAMLEEQQRQAAARQAQLDYLQSRFSPEQESARNWQAIGSAGAAMMADPFNPWGAFGKTYMDQRGQNMNALQQAQDAYNTYKTTAADQGYADTKARYDQMLLDRKDAIKGIAENQRNLRTALGNQWEYKVGPNGLWRLNRWDPTKSEMIDQSTFTSANIAAYGKIIDQANKQDEAFLQMANNDPVVAQQMKEAWIQQQMSQIQGMMPSAVQPPAGRGVVLGAKPTATDIAEGTLPEGGVLAQADQVIADKVGKGRKPYKGLTDQERMAYGEAAAQGDEGAKRILALDDQYRKAPPATGVAAPVVDTATQKGKETTAQEKAKLDVAKEYEKTPEYNFFNYSQNKLDLFEKSVKDVLEAPGLNRAVGFQSNFPSMPGGAAANAEANIEELKTKIGFQALQDMRDASKTGGALGSITERELALLQNSLKSLERAQSPAQFRQKLQEIKIYTDNLRYKQAKKLVETYPDLAGKINMPPLPQLNNKGWKLHTDKDGNKAYVGPKGQIEEVQ